MEALKNIFENLKERLKIAWAEQMESEAVTKLKERFEELSPLTQKGIYSALGVITVVIILWWPVSNLIDSMDFNRQFEDHRLLLKELLQIQKEVSTGPATPPAAVPSLLKNQFDQKIAAGGVKPEQVKVSSEIPLKIVSGAQEQGYQYLIDHLTVRQAVDLAYELEHTDGSLKILGLEIKNVESEPHFYQVGFKIVSYSPKLAEIPSGGFADAIKSKNSEKSGSPPSPAPTGEL